MTTTERVELRLIPLEVARALADPAAELPDAPPSAPGYPLPGTRVAARHLSEQADNAGADYGRWGMFQLILRETGEVIGDIGFHGPPSEGTVEIGYGIVEQYRGRGLVGEAAVAICGLTWSRPEVTRIIARTEQDDGPSGGVLRHAGFRDDGVIDGMCHFTLDRP